MVLDTEDRNSSYTEAFAVTTNPLMNFACPRSLFKIEKYNTTKDSKENKVVHFGEKIVVVSHDEIFNQKLYLFSTLISPQCYSRFSRNQEVLVNSTKGYNSCWIIEHADPTLRFTMNGSPVALTDPFILRHCSTGRLLASDLIDYNNDYGREYEMCCHNFLSSNKYQQLVSEKIGKQKIDTKMKVELNQNIWRIIDKLD